MRGVKRGVRGHVVDLALAVVIAMLLTTIVLHVVTNASTSSAFSTIVLVYSVAVAAYLISRFALAAFYSPPNDVGHLPTVTIIVPAFNEGPAVERTIDACLAQDYPSELLDVLCVDDGSTDDTWLHMLDAVRRDPFRVRAITLGTNRGKRAAMATAVRRTRSEIVVFVDSDSEPEPDGVRAIVQPFADGSVGAVSGLTHARNPDVNALTRLQAARYLLSFQLSKAAESVVGAVTCCSGCFAAYRRSTIDPLLDEWEHQRFLGVECTYGDDRALTNRVIRSGERSIYHSGAVALTDVPTEWAGFFRQQLRWKKSWAREAPILVSHLWRSRPLAFPFMAMAAAIGIVSPFVLISSLSLMPALTHEPPLLYVTGLAAISLAYAAFHRIISDDGAWRWSAFATFFYLAFSVQIVWAVLRLRDGRWGTRDA